MLAAKENVMLQLLFLQPAEQLLTLLPGMMVMLVKRETIYV